MNDSPRGENDAREDFIMTPEKILEWEANLAFTGTRKLVLAAEHIPSGRIDAYTEVAWSKETAQKVQQFSTGVRQRSAR